MKINNYGISKDYKRLYNSVPPIKRAVIKFGNSCILNHRFTSSDKNVIVKTHKVLLDDKKIKIYEFSPRTEEVLPALYYTHGGGFMIKAAPHHYRLMKEYAYKTNVRVFMIDYTLSLDGPYPAPLKDCYNGYKWMMDNRALLKINPDKVIIGGSSSGGCLAMALTYLIRDNHLKMPVLDLLIYPVLDYKMTTESMKKYKDTPVWNGTLNKIMWDWYLKEDTDNIGYASPLYMENMENLPIVYIEVAEFDCLRDEGILFYNKLKDYGYNPVYFETKGTPHGFELVSRAPETIKAIEKRIEVMKEALR